MEIKNNEEAEMSLINDYTHLTLTDQRERDMAGPLSKESAKRLKACSENLTHGRGGNRSPRKPGWFA